jgi:nitroreductase/NAD-dependent dihydropyrimidine dehydrogenase PreA subunit
MGLLKVNESKCIKDGYCKRYCPATIIKMDEGEGYPYIPPSNESACLRCGHCVAVCPHGALSHEYSRLENCPEIREELIVNEAQAIQFLRSRRSIRAYKDREVEREKITRLIEAGRYAPTAANAQSVEWLVLTDRKELHELGGLTIDWFRGFLNENPGVIKAAPYLPKLIQAWDSGYDTVFRGAPALIAASAPARAVNGMIDVSLALSYFELLAPTIGLGTCWAGLLHNAALASPAVKEALGIPAGHPHHYALMLGYPDITRYYRLPERKEPKITFK